MTLRVGTGALEMQHITTSKLPQPQATQLWLTIELGWERPTTLIRT